MKFVIIITLIIMTSSCSNTESTITISDVEVFGFQKESQQLFHIVGAMDGWSGTWVGETVEVYQYKDAASVNAEYFATSTDQGNISGWQDQCTYKNIFLISKGKNACLQLVKVN